MKRILSLLFFLMLITTAWADIQDTTVFKAEMTPDNEVPPVSAPGNSGLATITVKLKGKRVIPRVLQRTG